MCKNFWNEYTSAAAFEKQPCRNVSKINLSSEAAIKIHFQYRCSATVVKFFEKYLGWSAIFSKFPCNTLELWTTAAEKLYFITALKGILMQIWKSANIFVFIWKYYVEDFILKHLLLFEICARKICEKFIFKHSETIEYVKN